MTTIEFAGASHAGRRRQNNQDAVLLLPEQGLWAVADGMGGHAGGEVASALAIERLRDFHVLAASPDQTWPMLPGRGLPLAEGLLDASLRWANQAIIDAAKANPKLRGMGTTVVAARRDGTDVLFAHCGDSRAYLIRAGEIRALTEDHSVVAQLIKNGMPEAEAKATGWAHQITRALGIQDGNPHVDLARVPVLAGDVLVLCSDGLTDELTDADILATALGGADRTCRAVADALVHAALEAGGRDNVSVVVLAVVPATA